MNVADAVPSSASTSATNTVNFSSTSILVARRQQGNPVLRAIRNVPWQFAEHTAGADYILSESCCALFLSLRYHLLHPGYLLRRIREITPQYSLRLVRKLRLVNLPALKIDSALMILVGASAR